MKSLILMIQFMTRYPLSLQVEFTVDHFVRGMKWMPLVGLLVAMPAAVIFALADTWLNRDIASLLAVIMYIIITGGLHLDGIADSADGLFSYRSRDRMLEIMRDSTLGTNGVIAVVLAILLQTTLLRSIPGKGALLAVCIAPVLGRTALVWHSACSCYARDTGGMGAYVNQTGLPQALAATGVALVLLMALLLFFSAPATQIPLILLVLILPAIALGSLFAIYVKKRLGGITGDTIGASIELAEIIVFFLMLLLWKFVL